jgi:hypothetical protein
MSLMINIPVKNQNYNDKRLRIAVVKSFEKQFSNLFNSVVILIVYSILGS